MSCPNCFSGSIHDHAEPQGKIETLHGVQTYVSLPKDNPNPQNTILFFTDIFGLNLVNNKLLADHYAGATNSRVLTPDIIPGGGASLNAMYAMNTTLQPIGAWYNYLNPLTYVYKLSALAQFIYGFAPLLPRVGGPKTYPSTLKYTRDVREAMPAEGKLGVAGFCWGGYHSTHLCKEPRTEGNDSDPRGLVDVQFNAHPSMLKAPDDIVDAVAKYKVPYSCAVAEFDFAFSSKVADETEAALKRKMGDDFVAYEFVKWKGVHHGFSVRASLEFDESGKAGYEGSAKQAVDWFNKYLK